MFQRLVCGCLLVSFLFSSSHAFSMKRKYPFGSSCMEVATIEFPQLLLIVLLSTPLQFPLLFRNFLALSRTLRERILFLFNSDPFRNELSTGIRWRNPFELTDTSGYPVFLPFFNMNIIFSAADTILANPIQNHLIWNEQIASSHNGILEIVESTRYRPQTQVERLTDLIFEIMIWRVIEDEVWARVWYQAWEQIAEETWDDDWDTVEMNVGDCIENAVTVVADDDLRCRIRDQLDKRLFKQIRELFYNSLQIMFQEFAIEIKIHLEVYLRQFAFPHLYRAGTMDVVLNPAVIYSFYLYSLGSRFIMSNNVLREWRNLLQAYLEHTLGEEGAAKALQDLQIPDSERPLSRTRLDLLRKLLPPKT